VVERRKVYFIGFGGWTPWARRRILVEARYRELVYKPTFAMFPCKIRFNTESSELTVGHWAFGRLGFCRR